jgi:hypothetical protein
MKEQPCPFEACPRRQLTQPDGNECEDKRQGGQNENDAGANHVGLRDGGHRDQLRTDG